MKRAKTGIVLLLGVLCGLALPRILSLKFENELKTSDVLNWIVLFATAGALQWYWQFKYGESRVEKDLLIDDAKDVISALKHVRICYQRCYEKQRISLQDKSSIIRGLKDLSFKLSLLDTALVRCGGPMGSVSVASAKEHVLEYKRLLTGGDFPTQAYGVDFYADEKDAFTCCYESLRDLILQINRC